MSFYACAETRRYSMSTNLLDYVRLATFNVDASCALSDHWSIIAGARYNPFVFNEGNPDKEFQYRQKSFSVGARWWMNQIWSGWWISGKLRYQKYEVGGIVSRNVEAGDRGGLGCYVGYTHPISSHWCLESGLGVWGGQSWLNNGENVWFARPDDLMLSFVYVF